MTILPCAELQTPNMKLRLYRLIAITGEYPSYKLLKSEKTSTKKAAPTQQKQEQPRIEQFLKTKQTEPNTQSSGHLTLLRKYLAQNHKRN